MKPIFAAAAIAIGWLVAVSGAHATPTWTGDTLGLTYYYPNIGTAYQDQRTATVGETLSGVGYNGDYNGYTGASITIGLSQIIINLSTGDNPSLTADPSAAFNGWVLTDLTNDPLITDVTIGSETDFDLLPSAISFTSNSVTVNWAGYTMYPDSELVLNVTFDPPADPVPEPASLAIFATALGGLGFIRRRFRKAALV